jgi:hypothetical protein
MQLVAIVSLLTKSVGGTNLDTPIKTFVPNIELKPCVLARLSDSCLNFKFNTKLFKIGLNMQKVPALMGRLSFSLCFSKNFQIFPALSVNFKKGP